MAITIAGIQVGKIRSEGGIDKAVLCYSADHFAAWRTELEAFDFGGLRTDEHGPSRGPTMSCWDASWTATPLRN